MKNQQSVYCQTLERFRLRPNFWMSDEYLIRSGLIERVEQNHVWWEEADDPGAYAIPPLNTKTGAIGYPGPEPRFEEIWAGWFVNILKEQLPWGIALGRKIDLEFIYNPTDFLDLSGGNWKVFRKNIRKWPNRHPGSKYLPLNRIEPGIEGLVADWLVRHYVPKYDHEIHDYYTMMNFCFEGTNRKGVFCNDRLVGFNVWDENYRYINFRASIALPGQPFLDEHLRYLFYTDPIILASGKWVNDGGCLDNLGLRDFKFKLNPREVVPIHSWEWKQ